MGWKQWRRINATWYWLQSKATFFHISWYVLIKILRKIQRNKNMKKIPTETWTWKYRDLFKALRSIALLPSDSCGPRRSSLQPFTFPDYLHESYLSYCARFVNFGDRLLPLLTVYVGHYMFLGKFKFYSQSCR